MAAKKHRPRRRVSIVGDQIFGVIYLADAIGITPKQAIDLMQRFGNHRATLEREAKKLKK